MMKLLRKSIGGLKGAEVRFFFNDSQYIEGTLIAVKEDHLVVDVNGHVFYIALKQIYGISKNAKDNRVSKHIPPFIDKNHLIDVLNSMKYNLITINGMHNKLLVGLLISISEDCIMLVNHTELHLIDYSSIFNVFDGIYEQEKTVSDNPPELGTTIKQNTEQLIETPAILIHLNLEPLQDKIAESSFLEKNPSSSEEDIDEKMLLEKKAAERSITKDVLLKSGGNVPVSSLIEAMTETELDKPREKVFLESKDSSLSEINNVVLSSSEQNITKSSVDLNLKPYILNDVENEIKMTFDSDVEPKEIIEEKLIQQTNNEEIDDLHVLQISNNENQQPRNHIADKSVDIKANKSLEIDDEILLHKKSKDINVNQEDLLSDESLNFQVNPDENELYKKFYLTEPLSKHKIKQTLGHKNITLEKNTHSYCTMQDKTVQKNIMAIPCQTPFFEPKYKSETLQKENHESSLDEKVLFEAQYFALMKHAERMLNTIDLSQNCVKNITPEGKIIIKNQYLSLFKSSKKMYNQLKEERTKKFVRL